ncbi:major facilitator superfamily domain-containing protein [Halteromyces radiatus]|uniref:major facilitator superfamily domain-containing protein n=1 Tax=Halteromyces radiatus TaxID=101107 RepID=UPI00221FD465|nr:major facilitator superfamily domain-containing protein [Halteromyces radiatus]KAI8099794.1 major facilitator superfamily domain-containing protein [Halteromyces radiatus]
MMVSSTSHHFTPLPSEDTHIVVDDQDENHPTPIRSVDDILDVLLGRVGYGRFHTTLLILCGFGWLADNMWLQTVAIILPRVQEHFQVDDKWIGTLSSSLFTGMMIGSFFWGSYSDTRGRKLPYTMTLAITSVFGILSSFAFSFWSLCVLLFLLGFGVGGNMPTDGALYLEFLPREYHYLLTFMSVFFSFGAVLASVLGYIILPSTSCPEPTPENPFPSCVLATENRGWRIMLFSVGIITLFMLAARSFCLRLPETPKFLLSNNKHKETIIVLQDIAKMNGNSYVDIQASDLHGDHHDNNDGGDNEQDGLLATTHFTNKSADQGSTDTMTPSLSSADMNSTQQYQNDNRPFDEEIQNANSILHADDESPSPPPLDTLNSWTILMSEKWRLTVFLVWGIWIFTSMAFTMFNVFLPKYLETLGFDGEAVPTRKDVYWDYMIYSIAGVPGSVMASYLIETRLGRKGTMAFSAFGSALALFLFSIIDSRITMLISSSSVSFLATLLYAVIYGYTPEVFDTAVRGTAVGTASGLGRVAGIISPIVSGILLTISTSLPLYVSVIGFIIVGVCIVLLPYETRSSK